MMSHIKPLLCCTAAALFFAHSSLAMASTACGEVAIYADPPLSKSIYPVSINKIDDKNRNKDWHSYRLPVGKHKIYLLEKIDDRYFPPTRSHIQRSKAIEIDVKPNTSYYLGAKYDSSKRLQSQGAKYWEPVVWKTVERDCAL